MKLKNIMLGMAALGLSALTAHACRVPIHLACPNDTTASGIRVSIVGVGEALTDSLGMVEILVPSVGNYTVCVDESTLPAGATVKKACLSIKVEDSAPPV